MKIKKSGFTIVELLAIIIVLSIVLVIVVPKITNNISNKKEALYQATKRELEKIASQYVASNPEVITDGSFLIPISTLCNEQYIDCPVIDPRDNSNMNGKVVAMENEAGSYDYAYGNNAVITGSTSSDPSSSQMNAILINRITIDGKSEQTTSTHGNNLAPPFSYWTLENSAYLDGDYLVLPNNNSSAYVVIEWNQLSNYLYTNGMGYSATTGNSVLFSTQYYDAAMNKLSGNGCARAITQNTDTLFNCNYGGNDQYGTALAAAKYVKIIAQRAASQYGIAEYKIRNFYASNVNANYTPFVPDSPSPSYPSTIESIGEKQLNGKYKVEIFNGEDNLIRNGYGELGNNTNFPGFTYVDNVALGATKSFFTNSINSLNITNNDYIKVDPSKSYYISMEAKSNNSVSNNLSGLIEFDIDSREITSNSVMYIDNTLTTLADDLENGDTTIKLTSAANFINSIHLYQNGLIFWNYVDSTGHQYPSLTYSQNYYKNLFISSGINRDTNIITFKDEYVWNHGTIPEGTYVSQSSGGDTYNYSLIEGQTIPSNWTKYENTITGVNTTASPSKIKFRAGVKYAKFFTITNRGATVPSTTYYKNLIFREADLPTYTFYLNAPLRSLPDGTKDRLIIDNVNKRAYVERNIGEYVFTGNENFSLDASNSTVNLFRHATLLSGKIDDSKEIKLVSHFKSYASKWWSNITINELPAMAESHYSRYDLSFVYPLSSNIKTAANFNSWLFQQNTNGTPVTVQYKLAEPYTEELPYQSIQPTNGNGQISVNSSLSTNITVDYIG